MEESIKNEVQPIQKRKMNGCLVASIVVVIVTILTVGGCFILGGAAIVGSAKKESEQLQILESASPSELQPTGELASIFNLMSDHTDLQRENKEAEIKGKIVDWTLPVYELRKSGENYRIQTSTGPNVGVFVTISPRDQSEREFIEQLKTGDPIRFKGFIDGVSMRSLNIRPAVVFNDDTSRDSTAQSIKAKDSATSSRYTVIGNPIRCGDLEVDVITIDYSKTLSGQLGSSNASDGAIFVSVDWSYKNVSSQPINALSKPSMYLVSNENSRYSIDVGASMIYASGLNNNEKIISELNPGIKSNTSAVFEVAQELYDPFTWKILVEYRNEQSWFKIREVEKMPSLIEDFIGLGDSVNYDGVHLKIDAVQIKNSYGHPLHAYIDAIAGFSFIEVNWVIENRSEKPIDSKDFEVVLVPEDGRKYVVHRPATLLALTDAGVLYQVDQRIDPNTRLRRRDVFEVPTGVFKPTAWALIIRRGEAENWFSLVRGGESGQSVIDENSNDTKVVSSEPPTDPGENISIEERRIKLEMEKIKLEREKLQFQAEQLAAERAAFEQSQFKSDGPSEIVIDSPATVVAMLGERFPETRLQLLGPLELMDMNLNDLRYAINEMYARRGAVFNNAEIARSFTTKEWYKPRPGVSFQEIEADFSEIEADNLRLLAKERDRKAAGADLYELIDSASNIREGPGTNYPIIRQSRKGEVGEYQSSNLRWMKLQFADGSMGWVHDQNLKSKK